MKQNNKISSKFDKSFIKFVLKLTLYMSVYYIFIGFKFSQIITDFLAHTTAIKSNYLLNLFNFNTRYIESVIFGDTFSIKVAFSIVKNSFATKKAVPGPAPTSSKLFI